MTHRVTIYWKCDTHKAHQFLFLERLPMNISLNGECYLDVDDEQLAHLKEYESRGFLDFRHKQLIETPQGLRPDTSGMRLTNNA